MRGRLKSDSPRHQLPRRQAIFLAICFTLMPISMALVNALDDRAEQSIVMAVYALAVGGAGWWSMRRKTGRGEL